MNMIKQHIEPTNTLMDQDAPVHDWYRFVQSFPPHLVRGYIAKFGLSTQNRVLDPFCGTGTTLVECKKLGISSTGLDANPMAVLASKVKTNWEISPDDLLLDSQAIAAVARNELEKHGIGDYHDLPLFANGRGLDSDSLQTLSTEEWKILSRDFISPVALHRSLVLISAMNSDVWRPWGDHQKLALARSLVTQVGNIRFGPEIGKGPIKQDAPVIDAWLSGCQQMSADLKSVQPLSDEVCGQVGLDDARRLSSLSSEKFDAVITSPPYPNEKDYTRTTRLESVVLGLIRSKDDLRAMKRFLLSSNTRNVFKSDQDDRIGSGLPGVKSIAEQIEARRIELGKTSGFERLYHRVVLLYFGGMYRHLMRLRSVLRPGAKCAYVVGDQASFFRVHIKTGQILADIAELLGFRVDGIDLFRTRRSTVTRASLREEVVLLTWPGKFKAS